MELLRKVLEINEKYSLIENGDTVVVGFSGGPDSVFLSEVLKLMQEKIKFNFLLVHINHMLRGKDADDDETFCVEYAKKYNLRIFHKKIDIKSLAKEKGKTLEEVGREERYKLFSEVLEETGANKIATAHNKDDQIETFLFKLIRGTTLQGLEGINPKRENIVRPISEIYKKDILDYLNKNQIQYRIDKTNFENEFTRNSIRLDLIPFIEERYNNKFKDKVFSIINEIRENNKNNLLDYSKFIKNNNSLKLEELKKLSENQLKNLFAYILNKKNIQINREKINNILDLITKNGSKKIDLDNEYELIKTYDKIYFQQKQLKEKKISLTNDNEIEISSKNKNFIFFNKFKINIDVVQNLKDSDIKSKDKYLLAIPEETFNSGKVKIRFRKDGDKIFLGTHSKKIKEVFINKKIEKEKRDFIPIFLIDDEVFWIYGLLKGKIRESDCFKQKLINILITVEEVQI